MANRTDSSADTVHGGNPQYLVDRIVRLKIWNDAYWKEHCFALTTETLIDKAAELEYVAGTYGGRRRPAKFLCLILKMLQIQPDEDVVLEYVKQAELKYLRALGITYLRLTSRAKTIYETLEPLYADYRKLRYRDIFGKFKLIHMDELVDWLLRDETICDITMPQIPKREIMENSDMLGPRQSVLEDDLEDLEELEAAIEPRKQPSRSASPNAAATATQEAAEPAATAPIDTPSVRGRSPSRSAPRHTKKTDEEKKEKAKTKEKEKSKQKDKKGRSRSRTRSAKKKSKRPRSRSGKRKDKKSRSPSRSKKKKDKDGLTVEQWNEVRKELGLKPLSG